MHRLGMIWALLRGRSVMYRMHVTPTAIRCLTPRAYVVENHVEFAVGSAELEV